MKFLLLSASLFLCIKSCIGQDTLKLIQGVNEKIVKGQTSISDVLSDPSLMSLHSLTSFREVIRQNAKAEKIKIITVDEPGTKITVKGTISDSRGNAIADKLVYVYQTSNKGWYSDTAAHILLQEGDRRHGRLFGYMKTDAEGKFEFVTIKPVGYPRSSLPAHIHLELTISKGDGLGTELLFDDDVRLAGGARANAVSAGYIISKNTGTESEPIYFYKIVKSRD
jgi:protocatechuate 3,4-dioxygenase beta subunit